MTETELHTERKAVSGEKTWIADMVAAMSR
jgi:hypothetical protein